jgi:hypothetical protein
VAYGDNASVEVATTGRYFGLDINNLALSQLMNLSGTHKGQVAY